PLPARRQASTGSCKRGQTGRSRPAAKRKGKSRRDMIADEIRKMFHTKGGDVYFGEAVTQQEHALQAACLAEWEGAADSLVVAALLHDIGHLLHTEGEDAADRGVDSRHEVLGEEWLSV